MMRQGREDFLVSLSDTLVKFLEPREHHGKNYEKAVTTSQQ
jgi:hypothetical protein